MIRHLLLVAIAAQGLRRWLCRLESHGGSEGDFDRFVLSV